MTDGNESEPLESADAKWGGCLFALAALLALLVTWFMRDRTLWPATDRSPT